MAIQINDDFLDDLGLANASEEQKQALMTEMLETLELRVGTRLAQEANDEQLDEFERMTATDTDTPEAVKQKQEQMTEWLKNNYPNYETIISEELQRLKNELASSLDGVFGTQKTS
jgi:hypothetical protein